MSGRRDNRDKSYPTDLPPKSIRHVINTNKWASTHRGCSYQCVTDRSHFKYWRNAYNRDLIDFHRMIEAASQTKIPFDHFVNFAYSHSSGYISRYT